ncbi:hypothetical protein Tco_0733305 [Tanacetum coccineum]
MVVVYGSYQERHLRLHLWLPGITAKGFLLKLFYNFSFGLFNGDLSTVWIVGKGLRMGGSRKRNKQGALEMQLAVQRQVPLTSIGDHGAKSPFGVRCVFEIGITLWVGVELPLLDGVFNCQFIYCRGADTEAITGIIHSAFEVNKLYPLKVLGSRSVAKKVELKAYTCDINRDDGPEPILQDPIALGIWLYGPKGGRTESALRRSKFPTILQTLNSRIPMKPSPTSLHANVTRLPYSWITCRNHQGIILAKVAELKKKQLAKETDEKEYELVVDRRV